MPDCQHPRAGSAWLVRSVSVRTRDGTERLDQVYRRLLQDGPPAATPQPQPRPEQPSPVITK
jgi:hypothetical protein